jgi:HD-GYP domain-containing protein (c-di-GMP phosphodiesterase class II)
MATRLASLMGITGQELVNIRRGALLHDIGKVGIPDAILQKPGPLMDEEWKIMKMHPEYAVTMLKPIEFLRAALDIPEYHHEKWDGSGYPKGIKGEEIPLVARIFTVVDVWDALRDNRYYRPSMAEEMVIALLKAESGTHFDPRLVDLFLEHLDEIKVDMAQIILAMNYEQYTLATN